MGNDVDETATGNFSIPRPVEEGMDLVFFQYGLFILKRLFWQT